MQTEEQAKLLWCPMVRHNVPVDEGAGSFNRGPHRDEALSKGGHYHCCCIASQCAVWRWAEPPPAREFVYSDMDYILNEQPRPNTVPDTWQWCPYNYDTGEASGWIQPVREAERLRRGYCGLAGKPTEAL